MKVELKLPSTGENFPNLEHFSSNLAKNGERSCPHPPQELRPWNLVEVDVQHKEPTFLEREYKTWTVKKYKFQVSSFFQILGYMFLNFQGPYYEFLNFSQILA